MCHGLAVLATWIMNCCSRWTICLTFSSVYRCSPLRWPVTLVLKQPPQPTPFPMWSWLLQMMELCAKMAGLASSQIHMYQSSPPPISYPQPTDISHTLCWTLICSFNYMSLDKKLLHKCLFPQHQMDNCICTMNYELTCRIFYIIVIDARFLLELHTSWGQFITLSPPVKAMSR